MLASSTWIAKSVAFVLPPVSFRLAPEERMLREAFGEEHDGYVGLTKCSSPGLR